MESVVLSGLSGTEVTVPRLSESHDSVLNRSFLSFGLNIARGTMKFNVAFVAQIGQGSQKLDAARNGGRRGDGFESGLRRGMETRIHDADFQRDKQGERVGNTVRYFGLIATGGLCRCC
jgi:hypothetical protein